MAVIETSVQAVLAALVSGRCYPLVAPANVVKPYIVYQVVSNIPEVILDGAEGLEQRHMQFDIYAATYAAAKTLEESLKAAMLAASFVNVPLAYGDSYEPETQLYRCLMEYSVWN